MKAAAVAWLLLFAATVFAQAPDTLWTRMYGDDQDNRLDVVRGLPDGTIIGAGYCCYNVFHTAFVSAFVLKTDSQGGEMWSQHFWGYTGGSVPGDGAEARDLRPAPGGGYIVACGSGLGMPALPSTLLRLDADGNHVWARSYDTTFWETSTLNAVIVASAGGFLAIDSKRLIRTNDTGAVVWQRQIPGHVLRAVLEAADGGFVAAGGDSGQASTAFFLVKINAAGDTVWTRRYPLNIGAEAFCLLPYGDGGYLLAGSVAYPDNPLPYIGGVATVDSAGTLGQVYVYASLPPFISADRCRNGGYVLLADGSPGNDQLVRIADNGDTLWTQTLPAGEFSSVAQTADSGYMVGGQVAGGLNRQLAALVKYAAAPLPVGGLHPALPSAFTLAAYPNPFNPTTTLSFSLLQPGAATLAVFDVMGREVFRRDFGPLAAGPHTARFEGQNLASGLYFARLEAGTAHLTAKLLLVR